MASESDDPGIDPRYAPEFQRGYDPAQHEPARDGLRVSRGPVRLEGGPPPTAPRVPDPPPVAERHPVEPGPVERVDADEQLPVGRSRLEWALLGVAAVLLVAAGVLFIGAIELSQRYSGWPPGFEGQLYGAAADQLPGPLLLGGVLAIVAWIVLRAISAERRSR